MQKITGILCALLLLSVSINTQANVQSSSYEMMLIGSEFELCRSSATHFCRAKDVPAFRSGNHRSAKQYKLAISQIEKMMHVSRWSPARQALRYDLHRLFNAIAKRAGTRILSHAQLLSVWKSIAIKRDGKALSGHSLYLSMSESELAMILDHLEFAQLDHAGRRYKDAVVVDEDEPSMSIKLAKQVIDIVKNSDSKPKILVATVGYRDSYLHVDAYVSLFNQLGGETSWLPIDASLTQLIADKKLCSNLTKYRADILKSYDRNRIYNDLVQIQQKYCARPTLLSEQVSAADAIVFVGDDPKLLNKAMLIDGKESELLIQIRQQMNAKKLLVVAAGEMVRGMVNQGEKGAVVLGGNSEYAMLNGTSSVVQQRLACENYGSCETDYNSVVYQHGGVGLLDFPLIDTQVSSHGNIARLARVAHDNKLSQSIAIDKDTAVLLNEFDGALNFEVMGKGGVIYLSFNDNKPSLTDINYHYFTPGDVVSSTPNRINVNYPSWKTIAKDPQAQLAFYNNLFYGDNFNRFSEQACVINDSSWQGLAGRNKQFLVKLSKTPSSQLHMGGLKIKNGYEFYCSISALSLSLTRN